MGSSGHPRWARAAVLGTLLAGFVAGPVWAQTTTTSTTTTTVATTTTTQATTTTVVVTTRPATTLPTTSTTVPATTTTTTVPSSGNTGRTVALILAILLIAAAVVAVILLLMRKKAQGSWIAQARVALSEGRRLSGVVNQGLASLGEPAAAAHWWSDTDAIGTDLHTRFQALAANASTSAAATAATQADRALQAVRAAVDSDRALRLGPPPPTDEQLGYAEAVLRQRVTEFDQALADLEPFVA